jgi:hypothetical protein
MADVFDQVPPDRTQLRLEQIWSLPDEPTDLERLRAVVPINPTHAAVIRERIEALEAASPRCAITSASRSSRALTWSTPRHGAPDSGTAWSSAWSHIGAG